VIKSFNFQELLIILIITTRTFALLYPLPYMEAANVENRVKIGISFFIAIVLFPFVRHQVNVDLTNSYTIFSIMLTELILGVGTVFIIKIFFAAIQVGGNVTGTGMALGAAQSFDPQAKASLSIFASFMNKIVIMLFLIYNIDHFLINTIFFSFKTIPINAFSLNKSSFYWIIAFSSTIPTIAFQAVAPILVVLFLVKAAFGLVSKSVPQINIFFISSIVTIFIGMGTFFLSLPYFVKFVEKNFLLIDEKIILFLKSLA